MKRIIILSILMVLLMGCKEEPHDINNTFIYGIDVVVEEVVVTKYIKDINDYECKYILNHDDVKDLVNILYQLEGRKTAVGLGEDIYKFEFNIGANKFCVANTVCSFNGKLYKIDFDFENYFGKFTQLIDDTELEFGEIVNTENVIKIDIIKIFVDKETTLYLRENKKVNGFIESISYTTWKEIEKEIGSLIYKINVGNDVVEIYKDNRNSYYMVVNEKCYLTYGTLEFLDAYNHNNTDANSAQLPWV